MRKCNFALRLQPSLLTEARKVAEAEGVALNQLINVAVAEKLSALRTEDYFTTRAARADVPKALKILKRAGVGKAPMKGDELLPTKRRKAQTGPLPLPIGLKNIERHIPQHGMNAFDSLNDVRQAGNERTRSH